MRSLLRFAILAPALIACSLSTTENDDRGCGPTTGTDLGKAACAFGTVPEASAAVPTPLALGGTAQIGVSSLTSTTDVSVEVTSSPPGVLRLLDRSPVLDGCQGASVRVTAIGEGKATVTFRASDGQPHSTYLEVLAPRRIELSPYLATLAARASSSIPTVDGRRPEEPPRVPPMLQVEGGRATWETRLFAADGRALVGRGAATYTLPPGVEAEPVAIETNRELMELSSSSSLVGQLEARAGAAELVIPMRVVPRATVASIALFAEAEPPSSPEKGTPRYRVLAQARSAEGELLHGAPFAFEFGGAPVGPGGELFEYTYDADGATRDLVVTLPGSGAKAKIGLRTAANPLPSRSAGHEYAGCSAGRGLSGAPLPLFVAALVLSWLRRRRDEAA